MDELRKQVANHFNARSHIAHGFDHVTRVAALAKHIALSESYNQDEAEAAGLLHDIGRTVQEAEQGHGPAGVPLAKELLDTYTLFNTEAKQRILAAIHDHSAFETTEALTQIIQDADKLDGLGAVGIMRAYTSKSHLPCYDPLDIVPGTGQRDTTIHGQIAFQMEWLGMMYTKTGEEIAQKRYATMQRFLQSFENEVTGHDYRT